MTKKELIKESEKKNKEVRACRILEKEEGLIRFTVDEGISRPDSTLDTFTAQQIIEKFLETAQIDKTLSNIVCQSMTGENMCYVGSDVMWQTFLMCYATHRPILISPDVIFLLIGQKITSYVRNYPERFRKKFVDFKGQKELTMVSPTDLFDADTDWMSIIDGIYAQIKSNTTQLDTTLLLNDFSTTQCDERIASIATMMGTLESYYRYTVRHYICGIPEVTLLGTSEDWEKLQSKLQILKKLNLRSWYQWLYPVISEIIRAVRGCPNINFWNRMVMDKAADFRVGRSCVPHQCKITGWCRLFFPSYCDHRMQFNSLTNETTAETEVLRVGFNYHIIGPCRKTEIPMELWAGLFGVIEDKATKALIPKIGWFVRKSDEEAENLARLVKQDQYGGINLNIDAVPEILQKLTHINDLTLNFNGVVSIPAWFYDMDIDALVVYGKIGRETHRLLRSKFKNVKINPR